MTALIKAMSLFFNRIVFALILVSGSTFNEILSLIIIKLAIFMQIYIIINPSFKYDEILFGIFFFVSLYGINNI